MKKLDMNYEFIINDEEEEFTIIKTISTSETETKKNSWRK